ncbi:MAG: glycyl-radical enzyme activating protein [Lachnospiraceae bacterium]|nr:glycyl-radical enzyme activating protein [Lachnospiraceae bacterium]
MKELLDIQRFSLHDGEGIRTAVFLKGCPLHCPWCANPENLINAPFYYVDETRCIKSGKECILSSKCPGKAYIEAEKLYKNCQVGAVRSFGNYYSPEELMEIILKDRIYYENGGGVTFSGGEPLLHVDFLADICTMLKQDDISIGFETCLYNQNEGLDLIRRYADFCFIDVKILDRTLCRETIGGDVDIYLKNLDLLKDIKDRIVFRVPIVPGFTDDHDNLVLIKKLIQDFGPSRVEIFGVHNLAAKKYQILGRPFRRFDEPKRSDIIKIRDYLAEGNMDVVII